MFVAHCPAHGTDVLLGHSRLRSLANTEEGIVVELECYDGTRIVVVTGRAAEAA